MHTGENNGVQTANEWLCTPKKFMGKLPAVTFRGHLPVILCKKAKECGYEKGFAGRG